LSPALFGLVLVAAVCHAGWNFAARRTDGSLCVLWLGGLVAGTLMTPVAAVVVWRWPETIVLNPQSLACIAATGLLHALYFVLLGRAYEEGEISVVYPVARGSGIALAALGGALLLGEQLSAVGIAGIAAVTAGILWLALPGWLAKGHHGVGMALSVGATIPAYTLVDKIGVGLVHPVVYIWGMFAISNLLLLLPVWRRFGPEIRATFRDQLTAIVTIGCGGMLTYLVILFAYTLGPVGYVVAARESSVVIGALLGVVFLHETLSPGKIVGLGFVFLGLVCLRLA
jgi:drug/metabolite transporter (DMT)-like permease